MQLSGAEQEMVRAGVASKVIFKAGPSKLALDVGSRDSSWWAFLKKAPASLLSAKLVGGVFCWGLQQKQKLGAILTTK